MTLILGLNISDRIYLAADSRATVGNKFYDDIIKIAPLYPPTLDLNEPHKKLGTRICVAVAGDADLASFLYIAIQQLILVKKIIYDIRYLDTYLNEEIVARLFKDSKTKNSLINKKCFMIFGGVSLTRTRYLKYEEVKKLVSLHQKVVDKREIKVNPNVPNAVDMNGVSTWIPDHFLPYYLDEKDIIVPDSLLFSIELQSDESGKLIKNVKQIAEWGQLITIGPNVDSKSMPLDILLDCEFMYNRNDNNSAEYISLLIKSRYEFSNLIDGPVIIQVITKDYFNYGFDPKEVKRENGRLLLLDNYGTYHTGISFANYPHSKAKI